MKRSVLALGALFAVSASAKSYYDESNRRALVYFFQGDNVNASVWPGRFRTGIARFFDEPFEVNQVFGSF